MIQFQMSPQHKLNQKAIEEKKEVSRKLDLQMGGSLALSLGGSLLDDDDDGKHNQVVNVDEHDEQHDEDPGVLHSYVITHDMCIFALDEVLRAYRTGAGKPDVACGLCLDMSKPKKLSRDCLSRGAADGSTKMFQCFACNHWFGIDHYNEKFDKDIRANTGHDKCYYCDMGRPLLFAQGRTRVNRDRE